MLLKPAFPADLKAYPTLTEPLRKLPEQILFLFAHGIKREVMEVRASLLITSELSTSPPR